MRLAAVVFGVVCLLAASACGQESDRTRLVGAAVTVPSVVGEEAGRARRRLEVLGLEPRVRPRFSPRRRSTVIAQRPRAGAELRRGLAVGLIVSKGSAPGPHGTLRPTGVGPVEVGMRSRRVRELLGPPDRRSRRNLGLGPTPEIDWFWRLGERQFELHLDARRQTVTGYCTNSPRLATADGVRVGQESTGMLARRYGDRLVPARIGPPPGPQPHTLLLSARRPGSYPALAFTVSERETLIQICGGSPRPAGE